jgi:hypothetical protein
VTLKECVALLTPLALAMRVDLDQPTFRAYHALLKDIPIILGQAALEDLSSSGLTFFPTAPEIQRASEKARRRLVALHPYEGCIDCEGQIGFRPVLKDGRPTNTVVPCECKARHQMRLSEIGVLEPVSQLPGETEPQTETSYPTMAQIPAPIRQRLTAIAGVKVLR